MQNRYTADIGDFGKFQLLRYLFNDTDYKLTQLWYMYPDETHNKDGKYINYFEKVKGFDKYLEKKLKEILENDRCVKSLQEANLLKNINYFEEPLIKDKCIDFRKAWFFKALVFSRSSDIILTDSDNGIALTCNKIEKSLNILNYDAFVKRKNSGKYIFLDEIDSLYKTSRCLIVYHHLNRCFAHDLQISYLLDKLKQRYLDVLAIKHKPYSPRVYFILCKDYSIYDLILNKLLVFERKYTSHWKLFL